MNDNFIKGMKMRHTTSLLNTNTILNELDSLSYSQCGVEDIEKQLTNMLASAGSEEFILGLSYWIHVTRQLLQLKRERQKADS
ncbi:hypothetical protein AIG71_19405 [Salmonella enterica subsp. enterica]|nr:hypothetical protein [Salmonella enterica]EBH8587082.1 hypothetical protein [Salmonella enterica subsp. enterica serovar Pomona]EBJ9223970.1 hypothetical protein [Salmonella enterica]ECE0875884.1 hypothetical protein [Salmonella enterica subsp. enterica serovar Abaetetuba]